MNSAYGALLNKAFRYNRRELGASTTGTGREITIFMAELIGETLSGEPTEVMKYQVPGDKGRLENHYVCNNELIIYGDTDSVDFTQQINTNLFGSIPIGELYAQSNIRKTVDGKEYGFIPGLTSPCFDGEGVVNKPVKAVYRHKTKKQKWKLRAADGTEVIMTSDHSAMVVRDGVLIEVKPCEILKTDKLMKLKGVNNGDKAN